MNCVQCSVPLEANARFCRNCGLPVVASQSQHVLISPPEEQVTENTIPISSLVQQLNSASSPQSPYQQHQAPIPARDANTFPVAHRPEPVFRQSSTPTQPPVSSYQPVEANRGRSAVVNAPRTRSYTGCVLGCLSTLLVLVLLLGATWIFALRPFIHDTAVTQMDNAMANAVNQIPAVGLPIPPGTTLPISDDTVNALLSNTNADSDTVQGTNIQFTSNQVLLDFKLYGQDCTITSVPQVQDGKLVATNVAVSGIISLVLSSKDVTALLNKHLSEVTTRINHGVTKVHLIDHEIDVTVS